MCEICISYGFDVCIWDTQADMVDNYLELCNQEIEKEMLKEEYEYHELQETIAMLNKLFYSQD